MCTYENIFYELILHGSLFIAYVFLETSEIYLYLYSVFSWYMFINICPDRIFVFCLFLVYVYKYLKSVTIIMPLFPSKCNVLFIIFRVYRKCYLSFMHPWMTISLGCCSVFGWTLYFSWRKIDGISILNSSRRR